MRGFLCLSLDKPFLMAAVSNCSNLRRVLAKLRNTKYAEFKSYTRLT